MGRALVLWALLAVAPVLVGAVLLRDPRLLAPLRRLRARLSTRAGSRRPRRLRRLRRRRPPPPAPGPPIEEIAESVRRLGCRFHHPAAGLRHAKAEGVRQAYDHALARACAALEVAHLIGVLPPGPELDRERERVEWALECAGLDLGRAPW